MLLKLVFAATVDVVSVRVARVDVVLVDEAPEGLSEGDTAGWEAQGRRIGEMPHFTEVRAEWRRERAEWLIRFGVRMV